MGNVVSSGDVVSSGGDVVSTLLWVELSVITYKVCEDKVSVVGTINMVKESPVRRQLTIFITYYLCSQQN